MLALNPGPSARSIGMAQEYSRCIARVAVAQLAEIAGYERLQVLFSLDNGSEYTACTSSLAS
jgi:hypothetical protein